MVEATQLQLDGGYTAVAGPTMAPASTAAGQLQPRRWPLTLAGASLGSCCINMYDWEDPWVLSVYAHKIPPQFERKLIEIKNNVSSDQVDYCKRNLQYRAMVIFRLATDSMSVTVMSSRLSFFDKMSAFGKKCMFIFS